MLRRVYRRSALLLAASLAPAALAAQAATYRRNPADTLRLREVTTSTMTVETAEGEVPITSRHAATIAVAFLRGDSARAWYEALELEAGRPGGTRRAETAAVLRQPFSLVFDARGRIRTVAVPAFPEEFRRFADLSHQFDDLLPRLPAAPLRVGLAWVDTIARGDSAGERFGRVTAVARSRVTGDTTVGGRRGFVVRVTQTVHMESGGPVPGQPVVTHSVLDGTDDGVFVFSAAEGALLGRTHAGDLRGEVVMTGGSAPVALPQRYRYTTSVMPVGRPTPQPAAPRRGR